MRKVLLAVVAAAVLAAGTNGRILAQGAASAKDKAAASALDGTWEGTFAGDSSGQVTFVLSTTGETPTGAVTVTMAEGAYDAKFKTLTVTDTTMKGSYDAPGEGGTVSLEGTVSGTTLKGTWTTQGGAGTWTTTRGAPAK